MLGEVLGRVLFGQPCAVEELALQQRQVGLWGEDSDERAARSACQPRGRSASPTLAGHTTPLKTQVIEGTPEV